MSEFWMESAKQAPALTVLAFVVVYFLRFIKDMAVQWQTTLRAIGDDCHENAKEVMATAAEAIDRNTAELIRSRETHGEMRELIYSMREERKG